MLCPTNRPEIAIFSGHLGGRNVASSRISTCLSLKKPWNPCEKCKGKKSVGEFWPGVEPAILQISLLISGGLLTTVPPGGNVSLESWVHIQLTDHGMDSWLSIILVIVWFVVS